MRRRCVDGGVSLGMDGSDDEPPDRHEDGTVPSPPETSSGASLPGNRGSEDGPPAEDSLEQSEGGEGDNGSSDDDSGGPPRPSEDRRLNGGYCEWASPHGGGSPTRGSPVLCDDARNRDTGEDAAAAAVGQDEDSPLLDEWENDVVL